MPFVEDREPLSDRTLMRTPSVPVAEEKGARLLSPHRLTPSGEGHLDARIHGISLSSVSLYYMNYGTALTVTGPPPDGFVAVTLPLQGGMQVEHAGSQFEVAAGQAGAVISPTSPMSLRWSSNLAMFCLKVETSALRSFARCLEPEVRGDDVRFEPFMRDPAAVAGVLGCARLIQATAEQLGVGASWPPALVTRLREQVMLTLLLAQPNSHRGALTTGHATVSRSAVRRAVEMVEADPFLYLTPPRIAVAVGVGVRALQVGFRDVLGMTPHAYILGVRLRRAREELLSVQAGDGATVAGIARRWGFGNVGRFAERYHVAYAEKPSTTLRRQH